MHQPDPNRAEGFNCPECHSSTWAPPRVTVLRCRFCEHVSQIRPSHTDPPPRHASAA